MYVYRPAMHRYIFQLTTIPMADHRREDIGVVIYKGAEGYYAWFEQRMFISSL